MVDRTASVVVVGGGPAGIAAAVRAAESGVDVLLADESPRPGGQIWRHLRRDSLPQTARGWLRRLDRSGAEVLPGVTVVHAETLELLGEKGKEPVRVAAKRALVLATGARERFLPFPGWTLPGVLGVGGAQALLKNGLDPRGLAVVVAGSGPLLLPVASMLAQRGARLEAVAEQAPTRRVYRFALGLWRSPPRAAQAIRYRIRMPLRSYRTGWWVVESRGDDRVREVVLTDGRRRHILPCDLLCVGFGLVPATELARVLGCALEGRSGASGVQVDPLQRTSVPGVYCAGEPTFVGGVESALLEGQIAGLAAAGRSGEAERLGRAHEGYRTFAERLEDTFTLRDELRALPDVSTVVCRCEDVPVGRVAGFRSAREAKLHTRIGMGSCQGRTCGPAVEHLFGWSPDSIRPPVLPARAATLASGLEPSRLRPAPAIDPSPGGE